MTRPRSTVRLRTALLQSAIAALPGIQHGRFPVPRDRPPTIHRSRYRWSLVDVPHLDTWILAELAEESAAIASFDPVAAGSSTTLVISELPLTRRADAGQAAYLAALSFLDVAARSDLPYGTAIDVVVGSLELASAAQLEGMNERTLSKVQARLERATRHVDVMGHAVQGGAPGLGKRA